MKAWVRRIIEFGNKSKEQHIGAFAGQSAFFIFLSLFPLASILLSLTEILPYTERELIEFLNQFFPRELEIYVTDFITDIYGKSTSSVTILSILITLWSAAKGIMAIRNGLNEVYGSREARNYVVIRGISAIYTLIFIMIIVVLMVAQLFGAQLSDFVVTHFPHLQNLMELLLRIRNVGSFGIVFLMIWMMYKFLPNRKLTFRYQVVGAAFVSLTYLAISRLFSIYVDYYNKNSYMYGSITAIILVMFWLYFLVYLIFFGAQINEFLYQYIFRHREK